MDEWIIRNIRESRGLEPNDTSEDKEIYSMSKAEQLEAFFSYEGIIGYSDMIMEAVEEIFGVVLDR